MEIQHTPYTAQRRGGLDKGEGELYVTSRVGGIKLDESGYVNFDTTSLCFILYK